MKKLIAILIIFFTATTGWAAATKMYGRVNLIGSTKSVDNIPYADLVDGDLCLVITDAKVFYLYRFESSSSAEENSPLVITPDDEAGAGRWEIVSDLPTANTIGTAYIYRAGGTDVPDGDVVDTLTITNISQVQDISASASEINTPLDGALVTLTEFRELETIGETTISANQWALLGGVAETLGFAELNLLDGETDLASQAELNAVAALVDSDDEIIAIINASPGTQIGVPAGGSGAGTFTDGGILIGATAGAFEATAVGAAGEVLIGAAAANPVWLAAGTATYQLTANGAAAPTWNKPREFSTLPFTNAASQTAFSEANMLANSAINNQGAGEETDIILVAVSYPIKFAVETSEAFQIELCPPAGEIFTHDGTPLDANDCILSSATVGSAFMVKRMQIADASWQYFTYTVQGVNTDAGPED